MKELQKTDCLGDEKYAVYTGAGTPAFVPLIAGITLPNPNYAIYRSNADIYVFEYVLEGKGYVRQDKEQVEAHAGDVYILQPGRCHHYYADARTPWTKVWLNTGGSLIHHLLSDYGLNQALLIPGFGQKQYLCDIFSTIEQDSSGCLNALALRLHEFIQALSSCHVRHTEAHTQAAVMKSYIEQNLTHPLVIEEIAACVHLSPSRAIHVFKEAFGIPPYRYYLTQRLELAQSMLLYTALSIQEISERLGFADYHHFSISFKKEYGVSPMQFRNRAELAVQHSRDSR